MRVCVLCVECLSIQEESTPFDEPQPTPPHHTPTTHNTTHTPSHTHTHHHTPPTPNPPSIPNPPTTLTPPQQHPTTTQQHLSAHRPKQSMVLPLARLPAGF